MSASSGGSFATVTHARLRAAQGDIAGATRILQSILSAQPEHEEARALLASIASHVSVRHREPEATAGLERLRRWLERVQRNRGPRHV